MMQSLSTLICLSLVVQSFGLSAPCRCDGTAAGTGVGSRAGVATQAESASSGSSKAEDSHACCASSAQDDEAAAADEGSDPVSMARIARDCGDSCGCDTVATVAGLSESRPALQQSKVAQLSSAAALMSPSNLPTRWPVRWQHLGRPDDSFGSPPVARRLAVLQRWHC